ncbi:unnamed protein product [Euphydryas editha]|uniref:Uncharacterized protein n=1 Tax=Euphydryas editha TaxID=104508 RepID=A0AAU9UME9_EUPED|nr:unnamed protein product [Euphydryas editha]
MSVIAVGGVPLKMNLKHVIKLMAPLVNGHFEALNFAKGKNGKKNCYLRLSLKLDPLQVIQRINAKQFAEWKPYAFIPKSVPKMQLPSRLKTIPSKLQQALKIANDSQKQLLKQAHHSIMREMQTKYAGLNKIKKNLGKEEYEKFIFAIGQVVYKRLIEIVETNKDITSNYMLSESYRKKHPHFGDFQLIISTLHQLQDAEGKPRSQIQENELTKFNLIPDLLDNVPFDKIKAACDKYVDNITSKVLEHVSNLPMEENPDNDRIEEAARIKVREQMKKLTPYLPDIIREVVNKHIINQESNLFHIMLIYGEPNLPGKDVMRPWLKRYRAFNVARDMRMFNLLTVRVSRETLMPLLADDGTLVGGSKLVIRPCDIPFVKVNADLYKNENETLLDEQKTMEIDPNQEKEWSEDW